MRTDLYPSLCDLTQCVTSQYLSAVSFVSILRRSYARETGFLCRKNPPLSKILSCCWISRSGGDRQQSRQDASMPTLLCCCFPVSLFHSLLLLVLLLLLLLPAQRRRLLWITVTADSSTWIEWIMPKSNSMLLSPSETPDAFKKWSLYKKYLENGGNWIVQFGFDLISWMKAEILASSKCM